MLRQMVQFAAQRLMEMEAEMLCGASYDEKNPERINSSTDPVIGGRRQLRTGPAGGGRASGHNPTS